MTFIETLMDGVNVMQTLLAVLIGLVIIFFAPYVLEWLFKNLFDREHF